MQPVIVVHGGAGSWRLDGIRLQPALAACRAAVVAGRSALLDGANALEAVETAVRLLEDSPYLDAGRGSYPNRDGNIEMDALIMDGVTLNLGAVAAVQRLANPITLARRVLEDSPHAFLVGAGAEALADSLGLPRCELADLLAEESNEPPLAVGATHDGPLGDTVGAVAIDRAGNVAAATSTGGTIGKLPGRVGDSPLVGAGGYADNWTAAVSATGHGEDLMKIVISKKVCDFVGQGLPAQAACDAAIRLLVERVDGQGGVIAVDARGRVGAAYNTVAMPHAYAVGDGEIIARH